MKKAALAAFFWFIPGAAMPLGPHECVVLVNANSADSMALANFYADLRKIPPANIIHLDLPDAVMAAGACITPDEFRRWIYVPATKTIQARQLSSHILAWLYSVDFPAFVSTDPPMSLTGLTFTKGEPPAGEHIQSGLWLSPFYRGPDRPDGPVSPTISMENFAMQLTTNMPIPSMFLGWSGSRGLTLDKIKEQLRVSASSDGAQPSATVFFEMNEDVRSKTRAWQFEPAMRELEKLHVTAIMSAEPPQARRDLMGVMGGRAEINPAAYGSLSPGAYADHLTSFAAQFHDPEQTKLTAWLRSGAAGSSGTVTEPGSLSVPVMLWAKFPAARLFVHYAAGATLIESLYQSLRSPLQLLPVGDALAAPWAKPPGITLVSMADDEEAPIRGNAEFMASSWDGGGAGKTMTIFLLDGRPVNQSGSMNQLTFDSFKVFDGHHDLRAIAYASGPIRHQGMSSKGFTVRNRNRSVTLSGYQNREKVDLFRPLFFKIEAEGEPSEAAILAQERVLIKAPFTNGMTLSLQPRQAVGAGRVAFQAVAVYDGKEPVRSAPLVLDIAPRNEWPVISTISVETNQAGDIEVGMTVTDAEGDPITKAWYLDLFPADFITESLSGKKWSRSERDGSRLTLASSAGVASATRPLNQPHQLQSVRADFRFLSDATMAGPHRAGIVFNQLDADNFMLWGAHGHYSAWTLSRFRDGKEEVVWTRGAPIENERTYSLAVEMIGAQKMALLVDHQVITETTLQFGPGELGIASGATPVQFDRVMFSPPSAGNSAITGSDSVLTIPAAERAMRARLWASARDRQGITLRRVDVEPENREP